VLLDSDEPVSQLHKCAFEFKNNPSKFVYLSLANEHIVGNSVKINHQKNKQRFYFLFYLYTLTVTGVG
jgi:hypothetical protein